MAKAKKTTKKTAKKSGRVHRQGELSANDGPIIDKHPDIEAAAEEYREARDERMAWNEKESKLKDALMLVMRRHKVMRYPVGDDHEAVREPGEENVKVRKTKAAKSKGKAKSTGALEMSD